jgi:predicted metal-dependent hydrolase
MAEGFIREKATWLTRKLDHFGTTGDPSATPPLPRRRFIRADYLQRKDEALELVLRKIAQFGTTYLAGLVPRSITIRNQRSRWGSCSRLGNLSFNWKILFLGARAQDYLIVHELCHLREFNHSSRFWALVAQTVPEWREIRKELRKGFNGMNAN